MPLTPAQIQRAYRARHASRLHVLHTYLDTQPFNALQHITASTGETIRGAIERLLLEESARLHSNEA